MLQDRHVVVDLPLEGLRALPPILRGLEPRGLEALLVGAPRGLHENYREAAWQSEVSRRPQLLVVLRRAPGTVQEDDRTLLAEVTLRTARQHRDLHGLRQGWVLVGLRLEVCGHGVGESHETGCGGGLHSHTSVMTTPKQHRLMLG